MKKKLFIVGASGHGKVLKEVALKMETYSDVFFLDDNIKLLEKGEVIGDSNYILKYGREDDVIIGIGDSNVRQKLQDYYEKSAINVTRLIHPFSSVASEVEIGIGTVVMAGSVVQPGCKIGRGVILNTSCSVDHDNEIGDYSHISVGSHLAGGVKVGKRTWIGIGAVVSNNISICDDVVIGAGGVVVENIIEPGTYIGVPARKIK